MTLNEIELQGLAYIDSAALYCTLHDIELQTTIFFSACGEKFESGTIRDRRDVDDILDDLLNDVECLQELNPALDCPSQSRLYVFSANPRRLDRSDAKVGNGKIDATMEPSATPTEPINIPPVPIFSTNDRQFPPRRMDVSSSVPVGSKISEVIYPSNPKYPLYARNLHSSNMKSSTHPMHPPKHNVDVPKIDNLDLVGIFSPIPHNPMRIVDQRKLQLSCSSSKHSEKTNQTTRLGVEDSLLMKLLEEEKLTWKDIAARFETDLGKRYMVPALQMRLKRLRERMRSWTDVDMNAVRRAHDYWENSKVDIISTKASCSRDIEWLPMSTNLFTDA